MKTISIRRTAATLTATAVLAAGCNATDGTEGFEPLATGSDAPAEATDPTPEATAEEVAAEPEADTDETEVAETYTAFVWSVNDYDLGRVDGDDILDRLTPAFADEVELSPAHVDGTGERVPRPVDVDVDGDTATVVDCMADSTIGTRELPGGLWREATADLEKVDGAWKVARWSEWEGSDAVTMCLHPDDRAEIEAAVKGYMETRWQSLGRDNAPDFPLDDLERYATEELVEVLDELNREAAADSTYDVGGAEWEVIIVDALPDMVETLICVNDLGGTKHDVVTDEVIETYEDDVEYVFEIGLVNVDNKWKADTSVYGDPDDCVDLDGYRFEFDI